MGNRFQDVEINFPHSEIDFRVRKSISRTLKLISRTLKLPASNSILNYLQVDPVFGHLQSRDDLHVINYRLAPIILYRRINYMQVNRGTWTPRFRVLEVRFSTLKSMWTPDSAL